MTIIDLDTGKKLTEIEAGKGDPEKIEPLIKEEDGEDEAIA